LARTEPDLAACKTAGRAFARPLVEITMITAKDLSTVKVGKHANKLAKNWGAKWTLAYTDKTHSVWFTQHAIVHNETHSEDDEECQETWAIHYLDCFLSGDRDVLGTEVLVLENGLTPANLQVLEKIRVGQNLERWERNAERKRAGVI
jgi:hypothetical protein